MAEPETRGVTVTGTIYVRRARREPLPFEYTRQQILDGIGVLAAVTVALVGISTLLLGAWGW